MVVSLTKDDAKELECLCDEAVSKGKEVFTFKGKEWYTDYAKHVVTYVRQTL
jgi:hypothetical protein